MIWIALSEKDSASATLGKRLWDAAAQRAKLEKASAKGGNGNLPRRGSRVDEPAAYHAEGILYLPAEARFDYLLNRPEAENIGAKVNAAMRVSSLSASTGERAGVRCRSPQLAGVLPRSLIENSMRSCFQAKGCMARRNEGAYPSAVCDRGATKPGGPLRGNPPGGGSFARNRRWLGRYSPLRGCSDLAALVAAKIPCRRTPCNSQSDSPTYNLFTSTLLKELLKKVSEIPASLDYDAFGRIYEYFLGEFAMSEGQGDRGKSELRSPKSELPSLRHSSFVLRHFPRLSIHGVEKTDETGRLCRLNLAVHGLEGEIKHGGNINSYYDDPHDATGRFDFVLANPPFNVNAVDTAMRASANRHSEGTPQDLPARQDHERLKDMVGFDANGAPRRFPFGLPRTDNANYLWIQLFYSALNEKGRAGFVMANSASDARSSEQELRRQLIESRAMDAMVAVGPNMFYTVTLACTLWFMDKRKATRPPSPQTSPTGRGSAAELPSPAGRRAGDEGAAADRANSVLFIDARHIYRQVDRAHREWTPAQIGFLANLVRLYRGEALDFTPGGDEARAKIREIFGEAADSKTPRSALRTPRFKDVPGLCRAATPKEIEAQGWSLGD